MTKRVKKEEMERPKIMAAPRPSQVLLERVMGIMPRIVQKEVMKIASSRDFPASMIEPRQAMPLLRLRLILSIKIMAFFTTMPNRARMPIRPGKLKGMPVTAMPMKVPMRARGTVMSTIRALMKELNWTTRVAMIKMKATIMARRMDVTESAFCEFWPPYDIS